MAEERKLEGCPPKTEWAGGDEKPRWASLATLLSRPSNKFCPPPFDAEEDNLAIIQEDFRVLVVGAGGLGCEILKNLALSGFKDIELIDLDTIELSNLNRQFLFRKADIGKSKAECAAKFVMKRVPGCTIKWYNKKLQEFDAPFYSKFNVVIAGLDNVEARRWLNAMLFDLVKLDEDGNPDPDTIIPFIDGGTEGFLGQVRLFVPRMSSCFECSVGTMAPPRVFQSCTIASVPRRPEHCIAYAHKMMWPRLTRLTKADDYEMIPMDQKDAKLPDKPISLDTDDVEHMSWIFRRAEERAKQFKIEGVTYTLTMQVVKNIIPAIASTNALVSAACVAEAFKVLTWCSMGLDNYFMYMGQDGIYTRTFRYEKNPQCPVCGMEPILYKMDPTAPFEQLYNRILKDPTLKLKAPSLSVGKTPLFMASKVLRKQYEENFPKPLSELMSSDDTLTVTDHAVLGRRAAQIKVRFEEGAFWVDPDAEEDA